MTGVLEGIRVVVTRPPHQAEGLVTRVTQLGGTVVEAPLIRVIPRCNAEVIAAVERIHEYDALLVTSANAITALAQCGASYESGVLKRGEGVHCYAVGAATARAAESMGWTVQSIPDVHTSQQLCDAIVKRIRGEVPFKQRALYLRGQRASNSTFDELKVYGWTVDSVVCYDTVDGPADQTAWMDTFQQPGHVVITLYSPSAVQVLVRECQLNLQRSTATVSVVCIGQTTALAAQTAGLRVDRIADCPTDDAMLAAIAGLKLDEIPSTYIEDSR